MKDATPENKNKSSDMTIEEYAKAKESAERLLQVIDLEGTPYDYLIRIYKVILEIVKTDGNKDSSIRRSIISDVINNGVLRHYFSEENKALAEEILNDTRLETEADALIYKLNFLIPNNDEFFKMYNEHNGNYDKINIKYKIPDSKIIVLKTLECQKYLEEYNEYKRKKKQPKKNSEKAKVIPIKASDKEVVKNEDKSSVNDYVDGLNQLEQYMKKFKQQNYALTNTDEESKEDIEKKKDPFYFPSVDELEETKSINRKVEDTKDVPFPNKISSDLLQEGRNEELQKSKKPNAIADNNRGLIQITERIRSLTTDNKAKSEAIDKQKQTIQNQQRVIEQKDRDIADLNNDKKGLSEKYNEALRVIARLTKDNDTITQEYKKLRSFVQQISDELGMNQEIAPESVQRRVA